MPNRLLTVLLLFVFFKGAAQTAPQIIQKYLSFLGGEQHLAAIHSRVDSGTYNYGGIEFPFVSYAKAPDKYEYIVSFKGKYFAQAYDGTEGWKIDVFKGEKSKTILHGKAALAMANEADVHLESPFIDYRKKGYQATVTGMDTIDQRICVRISMQSASDTALYSFDRSTGELVKKTAISKNAELNNAVLDTYFTDYTDVEGIRIPFKTVHKIKDQVVLTVTVKKCELNRPVSDDIFDIDIHTIPARGAEPEHLHYDVRFLLEADRTAPLTISAESRSLEWVAPDRIALLNPEESIARMVAKTLR